jgi:hypothetical protein
MESTQFPYAFFVPWHSELFSSVYTFLAALNSVSVNTLISVITARMVIIVTTIHIITLTNRPMRLTVAMVNARYAVLCHN